MRQAIEEILRAMSAALSHEHGARRAPRRLRPHVSRTTYVPVRRDLAGPLRVAH